MARKNLKMQIISFENSIKKSNELSMSKLNQGLTLNQMQLLAFSIYSTQQDGITEFHKSDFEKKFNIHQYRTDDAKKDSQKILSLQVGLDDLTNDSFEYWNVFKKMKYDSGLFRFTWTEEMIPHILELKEKYITTDLSIASKFRSNFSWTLYDYIKAHHGYWHKPISKENLMNLFGVEKVASYRNNSGLFKKKVLDVAIEEINKHTELEVWYNPQKKGRAIAGFDLIWSTGKRQTSATKKQIQELKYLIDILMVDTYTFVNLKDHAARETAIGLIREIEGMKEYIHEPICITREKADSLIQRSNWILRDLNRMLEQDGKSKIVFYNWLEDTQAN